MSWAFLETMKRDFNWNVSYIQVSVSSVDKRWESVGAHIIWLAASKHTGPATGTLLPDTTAILRVSI